MASLRSAPQDPADESAALESIRAWLHARAGMTWHDRKREMLVARLSRVCETSGLPSLRALAQELARGVAHDLERAVLAAASTNHSYFFREPDVLEVFRTQVLRTTSAPRIRVWSAAASTGDEAYTLAIMAAEALGRDEATRRLAILGTDLSDAVVARAETAIFSENHLTHTPAAIRTRYFDAAGIGQYRVARDLRGTCTFRRLNLQDTPYPFKNPFHAIFCRNVFYYWDRANQRLVLDALYASAEPGAFLFTSVTEPVRDLGSAWQCLAAGVYRRAP